MLDSIMEFIKTFVMLFFELLTLFIIVSFIVSLIQQVVSEEKIKRFLSKPNQAISYVLGMVFGAMTPFCSCSTIPILAGLLNSKVPFGPAVSFLIASPLMNPLMIFMLWALLGWKVAIVYFIVAFIYGFVPETFITIYASGGGIISVFIASIIGIPMYIRPETMLPIAEALASKGMSLGTVVALIIGGAGASIPEVVLLSKLFKKKFVISFVIAILVVAISTGLMVNIVI
ncbi:permease [Staphylococcus epidermidis]|nr:permease [Staphylococcus epidermidis]